MLKAQYRLTKTKDIEAVLKRGRGAFGQKLSVKAMKNGLENSRFAFVVGVKVAKAAVKRNRLKRKMREVVRLQFDNIAPGYDVVVMARPGSRDMEFEEIHNDLMAKFKKLRLV